MTLLIITGSRDYPESERERVEKWILRYGEAAQIYVGDCPTGPDAWTVSLADRREQLALPRVFVARWEELGRGAGPARNREMVEAAVEAARSGHLTLFGLAFWSRSPKSRGTLGCRALMETAGIPVLTITPRRCA